LRAKLGGRTPSPLCTQALRVRTIFYQPVSGHVADSIDYVVPIPQREATCAAYPEGTLRDRLGTNVAR